MQYLDIHGNRGLIMTRPGTLNTDAFGLDTATAEWKCPMDNFNMVPQLLSPHPRWNWLYMEKRQVEISPGFLIITAEYAGITGGRTPSFWECSFGTSDEPIETHPKFVSDIAGKPSAPKNGAIFLDPKTGGVSTDDSIGVFDKFRTQISGSDNPFAGIQSYLSPQATMREIWISTTPVSAVNIGKISTPGFAIAINGNWFFAGVSFQQRGRVYANTKEWRASGPRQWNSTIYS